MLKQGLTAALLGMFLTTTAVVAQEEFDPVDVETHYPNAVLIGPDPEQITLDIFSIAEPKEGEVWEGAPLEEETTVNFDNPEQAIVTLTQLNFPDDSVAGMRYQVLFVPEADQWRLVEVGRQYLCRPGRGSQEWSPEMCS